MLSFSRKEKGAVQLAVKVLIAFGILVRIRKES